MSTHKLTVGYAAPILSNFSFRVERGEIVGILGPNGCGKSTLLKTLANLLKPISGTAYIDGKDIFRLKPLELARKMSVMLTERSDVGYLTAFDVVALGRYPYSDAFGRLSEKDVEVVLESLRIVNAEHLANKLFFEMSDGEKQKVLIARALAQEPEVMLLDEPTSFLDVKHKVEIMLLLRKIASEKGIAVVLTTHDIELALRICDRVILLGDGGFICEGFPEEVLTAENLSRAYGISSAYFDARIGSFEIRSRGVAKVHVVCGAGTGSKLMRFLAKKGIGFTAGVLHENDVDFVVAKCLANVVVSEKPYERISDESFNKAAELAEGKVIVDTGFPVGELNARNLDLLEVGSKVLSFRDGINNFVRVRSFEDVLREVIS